jgi:hypothetical protein
VEVIDGPTVSTATTDGLKLDEMDAFHLVQRFCLLRLLCTDRVTY